MSERRRVNVFGTLVDVGDVVTAGERVVRLAASKRAGRSSDGGRGAVVCAANVHMVMEGYDDRGFAAIVNAADLAVADGRPVVWAQRALGARDAAHVRGQDLMLECCRRAASDGLRVGLYGGGGGVPEDVARVLRDRFPGLMVTYLESPPFRPQTPAETAASLAAIAGAGVDILFVALGCPKQERWMHAHRDDLRCVAVGVGAVFDMLGGRVAAAPRWMQRLGLEWVYRLAQEPRRVWCRYARHNLRFLALLACAWLRGRGRPPVGAQGGPGRGRREHDRTSGAAGTDGGRGGD